MVDTRAWSVTGSINWDTEKHLFFQRIIDLFNMVNVFSGIYGNAVN